jgi:flavin-dependent dehydrogenase
MDEFAIVIVGGGPAGLSTALSLERLDRRLAQRALVLEKATYPRPKLCGGGVTRPADAYLAKLGLRIDVPAMPIHAVRFQFEERSITVRSRNLFRVVRRDEFDAALAHAARHRGLCIEEGVVVQDVRRIQDGVELETNHGPLRARVVVAADGANSTVRHKLGLNGRPVPIARLIEVLTPENPTVTPEFVDHVAVFDFTCVPEGVQGYVWDFPSLIRGRAYMNRGVFDSRMYPQRRGDLRRVLATALQQRGCDLAEAQLMGHPERRFDPRATFAVPHVLLVGDAAGVDPLLGEGIAHALMYGGVAAEALSDAFARGDFRFSDYKARLLRSPVGRDLMFKVRLARLAYGLFRRRWSLRLAWILADRLVGYYLNRAVER